MDAVGADQYIAARGFDMRAGAVEEIGGDAALVLGEGAEPAAGVDGVMSKPFLDGAVDHALQPAAVNGELRNVVAGVETARLAPDFLAMAIEIIQLVGTDRDVVQLLQQAKPGQFADRMRQRVDADAEFADRIGLSNNSLSMPRARSISAVVSPPMPPPTMIAFITQLQPVPDAAKANLPPRQGPR